MDNDRKQWITRPATLDSVRVSWEFVDSPSGTLATVHVEGRCARKRGARWTHTETVPVSATDYMLSDLLCHLGLALSQDRPATQEQFERSMVGAFYDQPELPF